MSAIKRLFAGIILLILLAGALFGYLWYKGVMKTVEEAQIAIPKAQKFDKLQESINSEKERCKAFIGEGSGDFDQYTYCNRYIKWSEGLSI